MGNLLQPVICAAGCVYLMMHVVHGLLSAIDAFKNRHPHDRLDDAQRSNRVVSRDVVTGRRDTVGVESRASSR
ncbi:MAG: hypothetical protein JW993_09795 [Sedimentisphaerales bacterium]|nr:hypothetical protein [Sedimentisphaerales bacterium]